LRGSNMSIVISFGKIYQDRVFSLAFLTN